MAINFLNTVDLNSIQIENIVPENATSGTIGAGVLGQMYFDTVQDTMMQFVANDGTGNAGYIEIGATSAVESLIAGAGIGISAATGNVTVRNTGLISVLDGTFIDLAKQGGGDNTQLTADLSAVDGTSTAADRFLTKANKWATIPFGDITEVQGGTYINVTNQTGPVPIVNHDLTTRTDTASAVSPASGATFTTIDSVTTNTTGHVTALNVKTVTLPPETDEKYTLPVTTLAGNQARISLTGSTDGVVSTVDFIGTAGRIQITKQVQLNGSVTFNLPDDVIIINNLQIGGELTAQGTGQHSFAGQVTIPLVPTAASDAASKQYVLDQVSGNGSFQGGYNAATNSPALSGASNVVIGNGDFYVVTVKGTFFTLAVEVGDFIFANTDIAAGANPPVTDYTVVIADANLGGVGATSALTEKGVVGFDSDYFIEVDNPNTGFISLAPQKNPYGAKQVLNNTGAVTRTFLNGLTTFEIDLANASLFGTNALAENVTAEVTQNVSPYQTVYADVTRSGSAEMSIIFSGNIAVDIYRVLLTHV